MPRPCSICSGPEEKHHAIDEAILHREPFRGIARRYAVSHDSVGRHRVHIPAHMARSADAAEVASADSLLTKVADLEAQARRLLAKSEKCGKLAVSVAALRELRNVVELLARITGELRSEHVALNVQVISEEAAERVARAFLVRRGLIETEAHET